MRRLFSRLKQIDGSFLLEAMIGTAILSMVMIFFVSVSMSAFLLMQRAFFETSIAEDVFQKVEGRRYAELPSVQKSDRPVGGGRSLVVEALDPESSGTGNNDYVRYIAADGTAGALNSIQISSIAVKLLPDDLFAIRYQGGDGDYTAVFYILKGER